MFSIFSFLWCLSCCALAFGNNATLTFTPSYFNVNEAVLVKCQPGDSIAEVEWFNVREMKVSGTYTYTMTRNCETNDTTVAGTDNRVSTTENPFELRWIQLVKADAGDYTCSLVRCDDTENKIYTSPVSTLTFVDLVEPTLFAPTTNTLVIFEKQDVQVVCQVNKPALVNGDQLVIEHILNSKVYKSVTVNGTAGGKLINASYSFQPNNDSKRNTNHFNCSNVNVNRPEHKVTSHVLTVHVEYNPSSVQFSASDSNTVSKDGEEYKVDLTINTLKVQCAADGYPIAYKIRQMSGPTHGVIIKNNSIDILYETMTYSHLRFRCDAESASTLGQPISSSKAYLNVYTSSGGRNEPVMLAALLALLIAARKLSN